MDTTVIQEIADQLGMAVDQAGLFIQEQLPSFAALKATQSSIPIYIISFLFVIAAIFCIVMAVIRKKQFKEELEDWRNAETSIWNRRPDFFGDIFGYAFMVSLVVTACFFALLISAFIVLLPDVIGWSKYPEAMLIDMALKTVG